MKKRIISIFCLCALMLGMLILTDSKVIASENSMVKVDGSYLTYNDSSKGTTNSGIQTRGKHMMDGECSITKAGRGRIYVYAATTANHDVDYLSTILYIDRYNAAKDSWDQIDSWQVEDYNTYFLSTSKSLAVDRGYFYRVHADHAAGMDNEYPYDEATSFTDGIWID